MTFSPPGRAVATTFAPATIGNVGPGFDVLGLAVAGLGDTVTVELTLEPAPTVSVTGRDSALVPTEADKNAAAISARAMLAGRGDTRYAHVQLEKGLAVSGGLGGSAASSVGGALAAALAMGRPPSLEELLRACASRQYRALHSGRARVGSIPGDHGRALPASTRSLVGMPGDPEHSSGDQGCEGDPSDPERPSGLDSTDGKYGWRDRRL